MAKTSQYELGFNWATAKQDPFSSTVESEARRRGLRSLRILKSDYQKLRGRVDRATSRFGMFLNTQAGGATMDSPAMLLCRSLKAAGSYVIEDPDDAPIWGDLALQYEYMRRAGFAVPRHVVTEATNSGRPRLTARQRSELGKSWGVMLAKGADRTRSIAGGDLAGTATRSGRAFSRGQKVLVRQVPASQRGTGVVHSLRLWHLFGLVVPCAMGQSHWELLTADSALSLDVFPRLVNMMPTISHITGLDWFVTDLLVTKLNGRRQLLVMEPANPMAFLGPGVGHLAHTPAPVLRLAAQRLVEVAWRHARQMPLADGLTVQFATVS